MLRKSRTSDAMQSECCIKTPQLSVKNVQVLAHVDPRITQRSSNLDDIPTQIQRPYIYFTHVNICGHLRCDDFTRYTINLVLPLIDSLFFFLHPTYFIYICHAHSQIFKPWTSRKIELQIVLRKLINLNTECYTKFRDNTKQRKKIATFTYGAWSDDRPQIILGHPNVYINIICSRTHNIYSRPHNSNKKYIIRVHIFHVLLASLTSRVHEEFVFLKLLFVQQL